MQTNETPVGSAPDVELSGDHTDERLRVRRHRSRDGENRSQRLNPRFTVDELAEVAAAADSVGMTPTGFCADSALAAARGTPRVLEDARYREKLARLQRQLFDARTAVVRFGTNVNRRSRSCTVLARRRRGWRGRVAGRSSRSNGWTR